MKKPPNKLIHPLSLSHDAIKKIANSNGTPLYIYSHDIIKASWDDLKRFLPSIVDIYYSVKANPNPYVIDAYSDLGANFEAASIGEVKIILNSKKYNHDLNRIILVGPAKTDADLEFAIEKKVYIVAESVNELHRLDEVCKRKNILSHIAIRINPGKARGAVSMGGTTPFGIDIEGVRNLTTTLLKLNNVRVNGLHFYLGTGLLKGNHVIENLKLIVDKAEEVVNILEIDLNFLDIGGGFGIPYYSEDDILDLHSIKLEFETMLDGFISNKPLKTIAFEVGRYLVGGAGIFIAKVVDEKISFGERIFTLDGGTNVFNFDTRNGFRLLPMSVITDTVGESGVFTLCGPTCTPTDRLAKDVHSQIPHIGDMIVFYQAGAYCFSASPGLFLSRGFPDEVFV
jgi:diaminopimelate decarboxylase